ncbi:MAG: phage Gp37/Gp68 family protein [Candidatus Thiodiazotropha endolucinida]|nr:phage Gp37/Gp68 family protein [Candidatus Thiodiazotropha taylori]MCW4268080.1 phage Gp37/Gp68 family protein [Candidatus Thiodiazotropha endolucinida]
MAETTEIAWTDSTFSPWWGCSKVAPGCDHCYALDLDKRTGGDHWGPDRTPRSMSDSYWKKPLSWDRNHQKFAQENNGRRRRVFCGSVCDWADKNGPVSERERLWSLIKETPMLDWQLLTKRAPNIERYLPEDWGDGYPNAWLGVTVEDRKHGLPRLDILREIPSRLRFLSIEPLLEDLGPLNLRGIHWVIVGGESGPLARPLEEAWVTAIQEQCAEQGVPFFFKQWGARRGKGGCLINGIEVKQWPLAA